MDLTNLGWNPVGYTMAVSLTACTAHPGQVFPVSVRDLNPSLKGIVGITGAYVSGYMQTTLLTPTLSGLGGLVIERHDKGLGKGYVSEFVMDETGKVWFRAIPKPFDAHHFDPASGIDLNTLYKVLPYYTKP